MATLQQAQTLLTNSLSWQPRGQAPVDASALAQSRAVLTNAVTGYIGVFANPPRGFMQQADLLRSWTSIYQDAFTRAEISHRYACAALNISVPAPLPFDPSSATKTTLVGRLNTAIAAVPASAPTLLAILNTNLAAVQSTYGSGPPAQNDASALAAAQTTAQVALDAAVADMQILAPYLGFVQQ